MAHSQEPGVQSPPEGAQALEGLAEGLLCQLLRRIRLSAQGEQVAVDPLCVLSVDVLTVPGHGLSSPFPLHGVSSPRAPFVTAFFTSIAEIFRTAQKSLPAVSPGGILRYGETRFQRMPLVR